MTNYNEICSSFSTKINKNIAYLQQTELELKNYSNAVHENNYIERKNGYFFFQKVKSVTTRLACTHPFSKGTHKQRDVMSSEVKTKVSRSIGLIHIDGHPAGTGFRVGEKYIVTCLHVISRVINGQCLKVETLSETHNCICLLTMGQLTEIFLFSFRIFYYFLFTNDQAELFSFWMHEKKK